MRIPLMVANLEEHLQKGGQVAFTRDLTHCLGAIAGREVLIAPSFPALHEVLRVVRGSGIAIASPDICSQDLWCDEKRAYARTAAPGALAHLGVRGVIVGRSERRRHLDEADPVISRKVRAALDKGLLPIVWTGDIDGHNHSGLTKGLLLKQVQAAVADVQADEAERLAIAYEPTRRAHPSEADFWERAGDALAFVRYSVSAILGRRAAGSIRLLYAGKVDCGSMGRLMAQPDVDGVLANGGASLEVESFACLVRYDAERPASEA